jgi:hypothetical protein
VVESSSPEAVLRSPPGGGSGARAWSTRGPRSEAAALPRLASAEACRSASYMIPSREERRLSRESQLACVREALHGAKAPVLARVIDQLVTTQRVRAEDVTGLLRTWNGAR